MGIHGITGNLELELRWIDWGCNFILHGSDTLFIAQRLRQDIDQLKKLLAGEITTGEGVSSSDADLVII